MDNEVGLRDREKMAFGTRNLSKAELRAARRAAKKEPTAETLTIATDPVIIPDKLETERTNPKSERFERLAGEYEAALDRVEEAVGNGNIALALQIAESNQALTQELFDFSGVSAEEGIRREEKRKGWISRIAAIEKTIDEALQQTAADPDSKPDQAANLAELEDSLRPAAANELPPAPDTTTSVEAAPIESAPAAEPMIEAVPENPETRLRTTIAEKWEARIRQVLASQGLSADAIDDQVSNLRSAAIDRIYRKFTAESAATPQPTTPEAKIEKPKSVEFSAQTLKDIIRGILAAQDRIKNIISLNVTPHENQIHLDCEIDAGFLGGKVKISGEILNQEHGLGIGNVDIQARGIVKTLITDRLGDVPGRINKYFQEKYPQAIKSLMIENGKLRIKF